MRSLFLCVASLVTGFTVTFPANAQSGTTSFFVQSSVVRGDMLTEWLDLQKNEVTPALKKAGVKTRVVLRTALGNTAEFLSIMPLDSYARFDGPSPLVKALGAEGAARLTAKLRKCVTASRYYVINRVDELSSPPDNPAPVNVTLRRRIAPGRGQDYDDLVKAEVLPVYKKAKAEGKILGFATSRRGLGATASGEVATTIYLSKFADLDKGPATTQILGAEGARKMNAKFTGIATTIETVVRARVADLSF